MQTKEITLPELDELRIGHLTTVGSEYSSGLAGYNKKLCVTLRLECVFHPFCSNCYYVNCNTHVLDWYLTRRPSILLVAADCKSSVWRFEELSVFSRTSQLLTSSVLKNSGLTRTPLSIMCLVFCCKLSQSMANIFVPVNDDE